MSLRPGQAKGPWVGPPDDLVQIIDVVKHERYDIIYATQSNQKIFTLTWTPVDGDKVRMFPQYGPEQVNGTDFVVSGNTVTYQAEDGAFNSEDLVVFKYFSLEE
jgi:hypothetical protein